MPINQINEQFLIIIIIILLRILVFIILFPMQPWSHFPFTHAKFKFILKLIVLLGHCMDDLLCYFYYMIQYLFFLKKIKPYYKTFQQHPYHFLSWFMMHWLQILSLNFAMPRSRKDMGIQRLNLIQSFFYLLLLLLLHNY